MNNNKLDPAMEKDTTKESIKFIDNYDNYSVKLNDSSKAYIRELENICKEINVDSKYIDLELAKIDLAKITGQYIDEISDYNEYRWKLVFYDSLLREARINLNRLFKFIDKKKVNKDVKIYAFYNNINIFKYFKDDKNIYDKNLLIKKYPEEYEAFMRADSFYELKMIIENDSSRFNYEPFKKALKCADEMGISVINDLYRVEK